MHKELQQLGLSDRETRVYYASLKLGKATVEKIAREAGIIRTTTYTQIDSLLKMGLMSSFSEGKKTYYIAENPTNLIRLIDHQKKQVSENETLLTTILPDLTSLYSKNASHPVVRFFPGREGILTMRNEILEMDGKELLVASSLDDFLKVFPDAQERNEFTKVRQRKNIKTKMLFTITGDVDTTDEYAPEEYRRVSSEKFPFEFDIYIFDDTKVALASLTEDLWGIIIESKAVAKSMKALFEMSWEFAKTAKKVT